MCSKKDKNFESDQMSMVHLIVTQRLDDCDLENKKIYEQVDMKPQYQSFDNDGSRDFFTYGAEIELEA